MMAHRMRQRGAAEGAAPVFGRVARSRTLADKVTESILETIIEQGLEAGDPLPSERELGEQFDVSRTVIREAVRSLAGMGVVEVISGRGLEVASADPATVSSSMRLFVRLTGNLDYALIHEVRAMLEIEVAGLAAERSSDEDLALLRAAFEQMSKADPNDVVAVSEADVEFHDALAALSHNPLHSIMLGSIGDILLEVRLKAIGHGADIDTAIEAHHRIVTEVAAGNPEGAREAMRDHLAVSYQVWRESGATLTWGRDERSE